MQGGFRNPIVHTTNLIGEITSDQIADGAVIEAKLADLAVAANKLRDEAVSNSKLADDSVSEIKIQDLAVTQAKIGLLAVGSAQIDDLAVTNAKVDSLSVNKLTAGVIEGERIRLGGAFDEPHILIETDNTDNVRLQSSNYNAGSDGWRIQMNGNVFFNDGEFRGTVTAGEVIASRFATADTGSRVEITPDFLTSIRWFRSSSQIGEIRDTSSDEFVIQATADDLLLRSNLAALQLDAPLGVRSGTIRDDTSGSSPNLVIGTGSGAQIFRSTSALRYKSRVTKNVDYLANIELTPTKHYRKDDKRWRYSLIADWLGKQDDLLVERNDKNQIEHYDIPAILAVISAKLNRLEAQHG